jgi:CelD/BcsL family acetyltransferase involved in cellulose biosynthesis/RimJ/RimL family protein N-acetyltransferase
MSESGELLGLWLLSFHPARRELVHAGAHQAEYHVWLALPASGAVFIESAWARLQQELPFKTLRFKYLPAASLVDTLRAVPGMENRIAVRVHTRALAKLDAAEIKASFAKKSNKSRFKRLKKLGALEFRRLTDLEEFEQVFDDLVAFYDFRQGAVNCTTPFRDDPLKRMFCKALFRTAPQETHLTVTFLGGRAIAGHWGTVSRATTLHVGMTAYSPLLAEHSPGKLHILQLSDYLLKDGIEVLDLTPGGDPWKDRFANSQDQVAEVLLYRSAFARIRDDALERMLEGTKRRAAKVGVQPTNIRRMVVKLRRARPSVVLHKVRHWAHEKREVRVYRGDRDVATRVGHDARIAENSLADLLCFEPGESWQSRDAFLSSALARLERGESVYTICIDGRLAHSGWIAPHVTESFITEVQQRIALPAGSVALYDAYTHPDFRGRGLYRRTLCHRLREAFAIGTTQYAHITAVADNVASRHLIESLGFEYQGSLYFERRFGVESKWADPVFAKKEAPDA